MIASATPHQGSFVPTIEGMPLCMPQGGLITHPTALKAEVHARHYIRGWTGGAFIGDMDEFKSEFKQ